MKTRLDKLLVDQGHAASRERAQALILAGRVLVNEQRIDKPGAQVQADAAIRLLGSDLKYVSRGGLKLERALEHWHIDLTGLACVDIGASTGGFTDCMLQAGAASVLAVDTGYGQIAQKLRADPRVTLRERTNARLLTTGELLTPNKPPPAFFAIDVSFISTTLVLPAVIAALSTLRANGREPPSSSSSRSSRSAARTSPKAASSATPRPASRPSKRSLTALPAWGQPAWKSSTRPFKVWKAITNIFFAPSSQQFQSKACALLDILGFVPRRQVAEKLRFA
jgi:TlyA family rRNA methyltransferase/putative hemolysin